jgi:hypothetical protein
MRPNLHNVLHKRIPILLSVCVALLLLTLVSARVSFIYLAVRVIVGLLDAVISADELTGGKFLSVFSLPLLIIGGFVAEIISDTRASFGLTMQYMLVVFCVDMTIVLLFRGHIERFVARRRRPVS